MRELPSQALPISLGNQAFELQRVVSLQDPKFSETSGNEILVAVLEEGATTDVC